MAATTTRSIISKRKRIIADHPQFNFSPAETAHWSPKNTTIYYRDSTEPTSLADLLHELGHALLNHQSFHQDIELINMETAAWQAARQLAMKYQFDLDDEQIDSSLDSYREWLYARSRCPNCGRAGIQDLNGDYRCLLCQVAWRANDARQCGLRRYKK